MDVMLTAPLLMLAVGATLVRLGWGGLRRAAGLGWAVVVAALVALMARDGAWGLAVGTVAVCATAVALVLWAGWRSPRRAWRPRREPPTIAPSSPQGVAHRCVVFALTVPFAAAAAFWLAFGAQAAARGLARVGDADAAVTLLLLFPVAWCLVMAWQMTLGSARAMIAPPTLAAALGTLFWIAA